MNAQPLTRLTPHRSVTFRAWIDNRELEGIQP